MVRNVIALGLALGIAGIAAAQQDIVTVRSREKPISGNIKSESPKGIVLAKGTMMENIATDDIVDIFYDLPLSLDLKFQTYQGARTAERDSLDPSKGEKLKTNLLSAIDKYKEAYGKAKDIAARRHMQYKIAALGARLATETGSPADEAIAALKEFKTKYPAAWQIAPAMHTLAQMHLGRGEFDEAAQVYDEMATLDLSADDQLEAQIQSAAVTLRAKKPDQALKKLQGLVSKLPKGSRNAVRAQVAIGECMAAQGKADEAIGMLRGIIKGTSDKGIKAAAYNALGESFMKKELYKEARWEFLWVDVVYNQDRTEHARALYNLSKTFDALGEGDRALECRELLASDRLFAGLEEQRRAQKELGGDTKAKTKTK